MHVAYLIGRVCLDEHNELISILYICAMVFNGRVQISNLQFTNSKSTIKSCEPIILKNCRLPLTKYIFNKPVSSYHQSPQANLSAPSPYPQAEQLPKLKKLSIQSFRINLKDAFSHIAIDSLITIDSFLLKLYILCHHGWGKHLKLWCSHYRKTHLQVKKLNMEIFTHAPPAKTTCQL